MTIGGGMVCSDGVLLYADTQFTTSTLKIQRGKQWIAFQDPPGLKLAAAIAGDEDYARLTLHFFFKGLAAVNEPIRIQHVVDFLGGALLNTYGFLQQDPNGAERDVQFLVAASTQGDAPILLKTMGAAIDTVETYAHIGCGWDMAEYFASKMFESSMPLTLAERLAAYILWEVKDHVDGCGGDSVIYRLGKDGTLQYRGWADIRDFESHFIQVEKCIKSLRLDTADVELPDGKFEEILEAFVYNMREFRRARKAAFAIDRDLSVNAMPQKASDRLRTEDPAAKRDGQ